MNSSVTAELVITCVAALTGSDSNDVSPLFRRRRAKSSSVSTGRLCAPSECKRDRRSLLNLTAFSDVYLKNESLARR